MVRLNLAHGSLEEHARFIELVRQVSRELGQPIGILADLQGPRIRTGTLEGGEQVELKTGAEVFITTEEVPGHDGRISIPYAALPREVEPGSPLLLDDGSIELRVTEVLPQGTRARVVSGGILGEHKNVNLPGVTLTLPVLTEKDLTDLDFALTQQVDYLGVSFARKATDIERMNELVQARGGSASVIAKVERREALSNLDDLLSVSDGVMVARGDLGVELSLERVPMAQKEILRKAAEYHTVSVTATQMLDSMRHSPRPTRAEASDVANAILDGTDAVMLSGETSIGAYPVEAVEMLVRIAQEVEQTLPWLQHREVFPLTPPHAMSHAVTSIAHQLEARAIVVFTRSGYSAQQVSTTRPQVPILAFTDDPQVQRKLLLWWGVTPCLCEFQDNTDAMVAYVDTMLLDMNMVNRGDLLVVTGTAPVGAKGLTNFIKLHQAGEKPAD